MAYSPIQSASNLVDASSASIAGTFGSNVGTGQRLLVVAVVCFTNGVTITMDDTLGTVFGRNVQHLDVGNGLIVEIWFGIAPTGGGADIVTAHFSPNAVFSRIAVHEYSGNRLSAPFDVGDKVTTAATTTPSSPTVVTTQAGDLVFSVVLNNAPASSAYTAGTNESFTLREQKGTTGIDFATEDAIQAAAGSTFGSFGALSHVYAIAVATYKAASGAPGGWSVYRPYTLGSAIAAVTTGGLFYYWRRRRQERADE